MGVLQHRRSKTSNNPLFYISTRQNVVRLDSNTSRSRSLLAAISTPFGLLRSFQELRLTLYEVLFLIEVLIAIRLEIFYLKTERSVIDEFAWIYWSLWGLCDIGLHELRVVHLWGITSLSLSDYVALIYRNGA